MSTDAYSWQIDASVINDLTGSGVAAMPIGGRFICCPERDDEMYAYLEEAGLSLSDTGQAEAFAFKVISLESDSVHAVIEEYRDLAKSFGCRLIAVEAGDPEAGVTSVVASELNYKSWWQASDA